VVGETPEDQLVTIVAEPSLGLQQDTEAGARDVVEAGHVDVTRGRGRPEHLRGLGLVSCVEPASQSYRSVVAAGDLEQVAYLYMAFIAPHDVRRTGVELSPSSIRFRCQPLN